MPKDLNMGAMAQKKVTIDKDLWIMIAHEAAIRAISPKNLVHEILKLWFAGHKALIAPWTPPKTQGDPTGASYSITTPPGGDLSPKGNKALEETNPELAKRILTLVRERKMSQYEIAKSLNIKRSQVDHLVRRAKKKGSL